jgi:hypothetical protein
MMSFGMTISVKSADVHSNLSGFIRTASISKNKPIERRSKMKHKKLLLVGGIIAGAYMIGRTAGIIDCVICVNGEMSKTYKLNISKAVWRPFKKGIKISLAQIDDET